MTYNYLRAFYALTRNIIVAGTWVTSVSPLALGLLADAAVRHTGQGQVVAALVRARSRVEH